MQRLSRLLPSLRVSHLVAGLACVICFVAGYLLAGSCLRVLILSLNGRERDIGSEAAVLMLKVCEYE